VGLTVKAKDLTAVIQEVVRSAIKEAMGEVPASDDQLDDATQLLMMVSGRIMSAQGTQVPSSVIDAAIHHIEQADGILAKAGLKPDNADISDVSEAKRCRG
jgi:hypothetical protein